MMRVSQFDREGAVALELDVMAQVLLVLHDG